VQFAAKTLTMSDLTFFAAQYRQLQEKARKKGEQGSKQKAINLNANVFVDLAFPAARGDGTPQRFDLPLTIYGRVCALRHRRFERCPVGDWP
jgi:hypothetical protein